MQVNGERVKLYDNNKLTIVDAAIQMGIQNEMLFPRRGKALNFTVDGKPRFIRGRVGEAAVVTLNDRLAGINSEIVSNDVIEIEFSTEGEAATCEIRQLPEYSGTITFYFNHKKITCPKFVTVNGEIVTGYYNIQENDNIHILNYYTLEQILDFMDLPYEDDIYVNNVLASFDEKIYENFTVSSEMKGSNDTSYYRTETKSARQEVEKEIEKPVVKPPIDVHITVNEEDVLLSNKPSYILVDILDFYPFDTKEAKGEKLIITLNGEPAQFTTPLQEGDAVELYWK